jgi:hypothetical protein|tara:strand:+ start:4495 stop:5283 length:789 start_codon:yes stop_codon:yes gene_type:complete
MTSSQQTLTMELSEDITSLQQIQNNLLSRLEANIGNLSVDEKDKLVEQINDVNQMMVDLYDNIKVNQQYYNDNTLAAQDTLKIQTGTLGILSKQVVKANNVLKQLNQEQANKYRLVEINDYYTQQYTNHTSILKAVAFFLSITIVIIFLKNKGIIPEGIYSILLIITVSVGLIYVIKRVYDAYLRSNMYYNEYMYEPPPQSQVSGSTSSSGARFSVVVPSMSLCNEGCNDQDCCPSGYTYVDANKKCVSNSTLPSGVQAFAK